MDRFDELFNTFIEEKCHIDSKVKIPSSKLFESFKKWLSQNCVDYRLNHITFTTNMKKYFVQFQPKKSKHYNTFTGLCLKDDYIQPQLPDYDSKKQKERDYKHLYYINNRDKMRQQNKHNYNETKERERELISRTHITEEQLYKRKKLKLIEYVLNDDTSVNWDETISRMNKNVEKYINSFIKNKTDQINDLDKTIECHHNNLKHYTQYGDTTQCKHSVKLINSYQKQERRINSSIYKVKSQLTVPVKVKLKIVNTNSSMDINTDYELNTKNMSKEDYIKFRQWHEQKSNEIWNLGINDEDKNKILQDFYNKYDYVDTIFEDLYGEEIDYRQILDIITESRENISPY